MLEANKGLGNVILGKMLGDLKQIQLLNLPTLIIDDEKNTPTMMQRHTVQKLLKLRKLFNASEPGVGKTLSATECIYATKSKVVFIACPNDVVQHWKKHIIALGRSIEKPITIIENLKYITTQDIVGKYIFFIVNYEQFQQNWSQKSVQYLIDNYKTDFLVFDEIHKIKQRDESISNRRKLILYFRAELEKKNPNLYVLGMTGTPAINDTLREPISQLELVTGKEFSDLPTKASSIPNILRTRQLMIINGIRCLSEEKMPIPIEQQIDCTNRLEDILDVRHSQLSIDRIALEEKIPFILDNLDKKEKTIIYLHYVKNLVEFLRDKVAKTGYKVETYTGIDNVYTREKVKRNFVDGNCQVLIASSPISVGVDGLQKVCHRLIPVILPWTHAEYKQLVSRLARRGQLRDVKVIIPLSFVDTNEGKWSLDISRWNRIRYKQSIGDVLLDGALPPDNTISVGQIKTACFKWLDRIAKGEIYHLDRKDIDAELPPPSRKRNDNYAEITQLHNKLNKMKSKNIFNYFQNKDRFEEYHNFIAEEEQGWEVTPWKVMVELCNDANDVIGDFGCGPIAQLAANLPNKVYSFDANYLEGEDIFQCDLADVPLEDDQLDVAVFSLSLMGNDYLDYLEEAHRCLRKGGKLYIAELTKRNYLKTLEGNLKKIGFKITEEFRRWKFTFLKGVKK